MGKKTIHKNPAVIAAYIGAAAMVVAAIVTGIIPQLFKPAQPEPTPSTSGFSSNGGDINIGTGENSQATVIMGDQETTINYYNTDPKKVKELEEELDLRKETIRVLLNTINKSNIPASQQTAAFIKLAEKYAELQQRLNTYEHASEIEQEARQALEEGDLDKAEQLLEQANQQDKALMQQRLQAIAQRTFDLAAISELKYDFPTALVHYKEVVQYQPNHLSAWRRVAKISTMLGDTQNALAAWRQFQQQAKEQGNARSYNVGLSGEAEILARHGHSQMALDKYQKAHQYFVSQAEQDSNNAYWQRDLSAILDRIGDMHQVNGDSDKAMNAYQDALKITKKLATRDSNNSNWQRNLSTILSQIGNMHQVNGDSDKAMNAYQDALKITKKLATRDSNNSNLQLNLSIILSHIGDIHKANGDYDKAINTYQDSLNIREKLAMQDPTNTYWQSNLSSSYERISDMHKANGNGDKAINTYQDSLNIREKLAMQDPTNANWQRDLIVSYMGFSEVIAKDKKKYLQQALAIILQLDKTNRLYPKDKWMIDDLKNRLNKN